MNLLFLFWNDMINWFRSKFKKEKLIYLYLYIENIDGLEKDGFKYYNGYNSDGLDLMLDKGTATIISKFGYNTLDKTRTIIKVDLDKKTFNTIQEKKKYNILGYYTEYKNCIRKEKIKKILGN